MEIDYAFIWAALIAFAILAYVVLDGFDLGVGLVFPFLGSKEHRDLAMNSVSPVWDGNETWLVLGGGGLYAVFPLAYATVLPALYAPLTAMLIGLIFRGVSFEFRWRTERGRVLWDIGFFGGSLVATFAQGIALGALVQGIHIVDRQYAGGWWDWLTPFSVATGFALVFGYILLGASWLVMKVDGPLHDLARGLASRACLVTLLAIGVVSLATPFINPQYLHRWFDWPFVMLSVIMPVLVLACVASFYSGLRHNRDAQPFLSALAIFVLCYIGIGISFYPYIVPPSLSIWDAAAPDNSLKFLLVGAGVLIPIILCYTAYAYWVFRGKVPPGGYH